MVSEIEEEKILIGSKSLKDSLPYGVLGKMATAFKCSDSWISFVISGKRTGDKRFIECAEKLAEKQAILNVEVDLILKDYQQK
jgi:hypothetical protein